MATYINNLGISWTDENQRLVCDEYGIRFEGAEAPITPTLLNGWQHYGGGYQGLRYWKDGEYIFVSGMIATGTIGATIFTLPVGYRPYRYQIFRGVSNGTNYGNERVNVSTTGDITVTNQSNGWCIIDIKFRLGA